ncbi:MAG: lamin tail domain-containing protein, partial [Akkermansiaceae bacterium]
MKPLSVLTVGLLCATCQSASADILISQHYEGSSYNKWIELSNTEAIAKSLDGFVLTSWNNSARNEAWKSDGGTPNNQESLDGFSIPANGSFLIRHASAVLPTYAIADLESATTNVNGDDAIVLYDTALGVVGSTAAIADALNFLTRPQGENKTFYRLSNGVGFDRDLGSTALDYPAVWGEKSIDDVDGAATSDAWYLHNFASNATDELTVSLSVATVAENGGAGVVDVTVARTGSTAADLEITLGSDDESEASIPIANLQIPAGQASATFAMAVDAVDDIFTDGTKMVTISATAAGFTAGTAELSVTDDGDVQAIVINEILANPASGGAGDANADGVTDASDDEFIELINVSGADLDLSNWEVHDRTGVNPRHVFTDGTVLKADCAIVVFGGGSIGGLGGA